MNLPTELTAKASLNGQEYAWHISDVPTVLKDAAQLGLACIGGEFQFHAPEGVCELYWLGINSRDRHPGESWIDYVARSEQEVATGFKRLSEETDFRHEAKTFEPLRKKIASEDFEPMAYLRFVAYFTDEAHWKENSTHRSRHHEHEE